ncbi:hypothetical protein C8Q77DRAFT_1156368 [Trametes polyzona]|nr:hypothetical protein C8Q77DRAFT_1156368 [Trametes polyzona]
MEVYDEEVIRTGATLPTERTSFANLWERHTVYDRILSFCAPQVLLRLARVSKAAYCAVSDYKRRAFNVDKRLSRFFSDPLAFRTLQARTATVISGSFALQFFDRTYYPDSDLDLYAHPDRGFIEVGLYLQSEGYVYEPYSWQLDDFCEEAERLCEDIKKPLSRIDDEAEFASLYDMSSMRAVYTFVRRRAADTLEGSATRQVQIIVSRTSPMASLLDFHSTCVMNMITYNAAYALYPHATFVRGVTLAINDKAPNARDALVKYSHRGWRTIANPSPLTFSLEPRAFQLNAPRWVSDEHSWAIPLSMDGVTPPPLASPMSDPLTWDPIVECGWSLQLVEDEVRPVFRKISTSIFRWGYTEGCAEYFDRLLNFFAAQGHVEHMKVPEGKTAADCRDIWVWWDAALPVLRHRFCMEREWVVIQGRS